MRNLVSVTALVVLLGACAEAPQEALHTLRPSVPWPESQKPAQAASATDIAKSIDAMPITSFAPETDAQIQAILIERSLASFGGSCACPYSIDQAGQRCGSTSAYDRPGRRSLLCYPSDVTAKMVADYRARR